jgi:hypothetical protein
MHRGLQASTFDTDHQITAFCVLTQHRTQYCGMTVFHDSIMPSFSVGQNYVHIDIEVIPPTQW